MFIQVILRVYNWKLLLAYWLPVFGSYGWNLIGIIKISHNCPHTCLTSYVQQYFHQGGFSILLKLLVVFWKSFFIFFSLEAWMPLPHFPNPSTVALCDFDPLSYLPLTLASQCFKD